MIYLELFLTFLKIGAFSFGGGYGMISIIRETVLEKGWLNEAELLNFIAVSESTPGPIAVNMATFIGSSQGGILGALVATLGIILPSFIIILLIATLIKKVIKYKGVKATLDGIRPAILGLIFSTFVIMFLSSIFNLQTINSDFVFDWKGLIVFIFLTLLSIIFFKFKKKKISPILLISLSGVLGLLIYGF